MNRYAGLEDDESAEKAEEVEEEEEEPLNSDDDQSDDEDLETLFDADNVTKLSNSYILLIPTNL